MPMKTNNLVACGECDLLQREVELPPGGTARCARCEAQLYRSKPASLDVTLALLVAAAILFAFANAYPLMGLDARGIRTSATLWDTAGALYARDMPSVATLVLVTVIVAPALQLGAMLYMLLPLKLGFVPQGLHTAFRITNLAQPWGMLEVFLLGSLVSLVKLTQVAKIDLEPGIVAVGGYVVLLASAMSAFEPRELWRRVEELGTPLPAAQEQEEGGPA
jgi:paraquat-inducible protein A